MRQITSEVIKANIKVIVIQWEKMSVIVCNRGMGDLFKTTGDKA